MKNIITASFLLFLSLPALAVLECEEQKSGDMLYIAPAVQRTSGGTGGYIYDSEGRLQWAIFVDGNIYTPITQSKTELEQKPATSYKYTSSYQDKSVELVLDNKTYKAVLIATGKKDRNFKCGRSNSGE